MAVILQATFSNSLSFIKLLYYDSDFDGIVPKGQVNNQPALVQIMTLFPTSHTPLYEAMIV